MKKLIVMFFIVFAVSFVFADKVSIHLKSGKSVNGKMVKIEAGSIDGKNLTETTSINAAQGMNELLIQISDIKEIVFKSGDDVSCFEDGRFIPLRKFCSMKSIYYITLKKPSKSKEPIEITDDRVFFFHVQGTKEPVKAAFYKIQVSSEGREDKVDYPDLEREVLSYKKNGIKKIKFN
jgi:hypothetical protein